MAQDSDLPLCNALALRKATRRVSRHYDAVLAPCGLRTTQFSILAHLERLGAPAMNELAAAMALDRSALGHNLRPLERDGLLELRATKADRRARVVVLTPDGTAALQRARALWERAQADFEFAFGAPEAEALRTTLDRLTRLEFRAAAR